MKDPKMEREDGGPDSYVCANCGNEWPFEKLDDISDLGERFEAGDTVPAGECPTCGALCYPGEDAYPDRHERQAQPHCPTCGCDLHDGKCPEGHEVAADA